MPWALLLKPSVILSVFLALSVVGNYTLFKMRDAALKHVGAVQAELDQAVAAGKKCSDGVLALKKAAVAREKQMRAALAEAQKLADAAARRAQTTLQTPPSVPGDMCVSAAVLNSEKLTERAARRRP